MASLDQVITGLGGGSVALALLAAFLLGLRHATDPDHLTAVSTLALGHGAGGARRATALGLGWGLGHATTLILLGLPVVVLGSAIPAWVSTAAELTIGVVIAGLAVRLLVRWRQGYFHVHEHTHGGVRHAHPHVHQHRHGEAHGHGDEHRHAHPDDLGRSPAAAYGIGLVHGIGGSAGVGILLVGGVSGSGPAVAVLLVFAAATAASMALVSWAVGAALARGPLLRHFERLAPVLGTLSLMFGVWYGAGAAGSAM